MKISMWIVNDWLKDYDPKPRITKGKMNIKGVRYFAEGIEPEEDLLYVGHAADFVPTQTDEVICACGEDLLFLAGEDIYTIFNEIQQMLEYYNEWEMSILRSIEEGRQLNEILEDTLPVFDKTILVTDASHLPLAIAHHPEEQLHFTYENGRISSADLLKLNDVLRDFTSVHGPYITDSGYEPKDLIRNFYASNGDLIGWFVCMEGAEESRVNARLQLTEAFCRLLDFWFRINENSLLLSPQSSLFMDVLDGKETDPAVLRFKQEGIGWTGEPEMQLFVLRSQEMNRLDLAFLQSSLSSSFSSFYCFNYQSSALIIVNYGQVSQKEFHRQLSAFLKKRKTWCGASYPFKDLNNLPTYHKQAALALRFGKEKPGAINPIEAYALEYLRQQFGDISEAAISSPVLEQLKQYDASAGTEYYRTLEVYLLHERDQTLSAEILCIHRNTLIYRIKKIESMIEADLNDARTRFALLQFFFISDPDFLN